MKVMSAIHKRLHYAQRNEFRLLARIFSENLAPMYPYQVAGAEQGVKAEDFDARVDVLPVSDPNIFSMAQRVTLAQTQLQLAQSNPQMHNLPAAYRRMYQALEVQNIDEILPPEQEPQPTDPATEDAAIIGGKPVKAFPQQDHDAHMKAHLSLLELDVLQQTPPVLAALFSHILEHVSLKARNMVQEEVQQMQMQQQQEMQAATAQLQNLVQAGAIPMQQAQMQMQQMQMQTQQSQMPPDQMEAKVAQVEGELLMEVIPLMSHKGTGAEDQDPLVTIRMQELAIKEMETEQKSQMDVAKLALEELKLEQSATADSARLELQEQIADDRTDVNRERIDVQRQAMEQRNAS